MPVPLDVILKTYMAIIKHRLWTFTFVILVLLVLFYTSRYGSSPPPLPPTRSYLPKNGAFNGTWKFARDARNLFLTHSQCDQAFPRLFEEVDRPVSKRRSRQITLKEIDEIVPLNGYIRAMVYDQEVR
jgi:hypothetical protein